MKLMPHQEEGQSLLKEGGYCGILADDMGLGKTLTGISCLRELPGAKLIVCPAGLIEMWRTNLASEGVTANVISYGQLHKVLSYFEVVLFDECHALKNIDSRRTRAARKLCKHSRVCLFLSGTPMTDRPRDLFPALNIILEKRRALGMEVKGEYYLSDYWRFVERFCDGHYETIHTLAGSKREILLSNKASHEQELREILAELMVRREKSILNLPPKRVKFVYIQNSDRLGELKYQQQIYDAQHMEFKKSKLPYIHLISQYRQFAVYQKIDSIVKQVHAIAYPPEHMDKVVIGCHHKNVIEVLKVRLRMYNPLVITGDTPKEERQPIVKQFQEEYKNRVIICSILAAGVGITLTAAHHVIIAEPTWTPAEMDQFEDRCHRIGQTEPVTIYYMALKDSIDEQMFTLLREKKNIINSIL